MQVSVYWRFPAVEKHWFRQNLFDRIGSKRRRGKKRLFMKENAFFLLRAWRGGRGVARNWKTYEKSFGKNFGSGCGSNYRRCHHHDVVVVVIAVSVVAGVVVIAVFVLAIDVAVFFIAAVAVLAIVVAVFCCSCCCSS